MAYFPQNKTVAVGDTVIDYAVFGHGKKNLVLLPGLSIRSVKGTALMLAAMYRLFSKDYTVYVLDKKRVVPEGYSIWDIADDTASAMQKLGIMSASIMGVSQGGMVAQVLAIRYPDLVEKLVLCVTACEPNPTMEDVVGTWIDLAQKGDWKTFNCLTFEKMYSKAYLKRYGAMIPIVAGLSKCRDVPRFVTLAKACLAFDGSAQLSKISCPTFVIGAKNDLVLTGEASDKIAQILSCEVYLYEDYSHGVYDETGDFNQRVLAFLKK